MPQWPLAERPSERPAALQALRAHARGSLPCPAKPVWARVFGPMTHSFWACDRAQMHPQPLPLQLRPETPSTGVQSARPAGHLRPRALAFRVPAPAGCLHSGALVYRMPAPAGHPPPPHSPIVQGSRALSGLAIRVFPGSQCWSSCCGSARLLAVLEPSKRPPTCPLPTSPGSLGAPTQHLRAVICRGFKWAQTPSPPCLCCRTRCGWFLIRDALKEQSNTFIWKGVF